MQLHCKGTKTLPSEKLVTCNDERRWEARVKLVGILSIQNLGTETEKAKVVSSDDGKLEEVVKVEDI